MTNDHLLDAAAVRTRVDGFIEAYLDQAIERSAHISSDYRQLWTVIKDVYTAGGKRYRPYICVLTYQALGGKDLAPIIPVAALLELLHVALLAIDDVIDRDYIRHGHPNIAGTYVKHYEQALPDTIERYHYANSAAMLAENLLISSVYDIIAQAPLEDSQRGIVNALVHDAIFTVAGGELLDVEAAFKPTADPDHWLTVAKYKTADYTFITPMRLGAHLVGAPAAKIEAVRDIGESIGIAFQLADDLVDIFSDTTESGKTAFSDIMEGKATYLLQQTFARATDDDQQFIRRCMKPEPISNEHGARIRAIMETCGARAAVIDAIHAYAAQARTGIDTLGLSPEAQTAFHNLIDKAAWRTK